MIITDINVDDDAVTVFLTLPGPDAGLSKADILDIFARELRNNAWRFARDVLGKRFRLNGRMTVEMALVAGAVAARLGAARVEIFDPATGGYTPVMGDGCAMAMPVPILPGMEVEFIQDTPLFRRGARAAVINVGHEQVNVAATERGGRRRDTGWTDVRNVRPVGWERAPNI